MFTTTPFAYLTLHLTEPSFAKRNEPTPVRHTVLANTLGGRNFAPAPLRSKSRVISPDLGA